MVALKTDTKIPRFGRVTILCWIVFAFLGAYAGPFGTYEYDLGSRFLFWSGVVVFSSLLGRLCTYLSIRTVGTSQPIATDALTVVLMTLLFTPVLYWLTRFFLTSKPNAGSYLYFAQYVAIISICVTVLRRFLAETWRWHLTTAEPETEQPRLTRRLPDDFQGPIVRLTVRDHFVDVVTVAETHRIRLRFADAIDEMDTVVGYCTHRSHWVAAQAIIAVEREAGRIVLRLVNGDLVPVSRSYKAELEEAGVL